MTHNLLHELFDIVQLPVAALVLDLVKPELVVLQERLQQLARVLTVLKTDRNLTIEAGGITLMGRIGSIEP